MGDKGCKFNGTCPVYHRGIIRGFKRVLSSIHEFIMDILTSHAKTQLILGNNILK